MEANSQMGRQWTGRYDGSGKGIVVLDVDDEGNELRCTANLFDDDDALPGSLAVLTIPGRSLNISTNVATFPINRAQASVVQPNNMATVFPNVVFPASADISIKEIKGAVRVKWRTGIGTHGSARLTSREPESKSLYVSEAGINTWPKFKKFIGGLDHDRYIFRGQTSTWKLRTAFHRTNRSDLVKFIATDIPRLSERLGALLEYVFDMGRAGELGGLYNLAQHHGYPTPMLDWTRSPFIASYFAFRYGTAVRNNNDKVRIYVFDAKAWREDWRQLDKIAFSSPHFSIIELLPFRNTRAIPQQSLLTVTNIDDVESYIRNLEKIRGKRYLRVVDLPVAERRQATRDLNMMGITAGALFPGLDGACEELRSRHFDF